MPFTRHMIFARTTFKAFLFLLALLVPGWQLAAASAAPAPAVPATPQPPKKELSKPVLDAFPEIDKMMSEEVHNYDGAIAAINTLLAQVVHDSFDTAVLSQMKAQALFGKGDYMSSIAPIETALSLSEKYGFFGKKDVDLLWMLAQLYTQDASTEKNPMLQQQKYTKALSALRRWLAITPKANYEAYIYIASILFQQATGTGDTKITDKDQLKPGDRDLLKQAEEAVLSGMTLTPKPKDGAYQLLVAIAQALGDQAKSAKYLEVLVQNNPKNSSYWGTLFNIYYATIESTPKDSFLRNQAYAMAVYTINRAQQNGFMLTPTDYYNKVVMYINSEQYEGAADLLESSLRTGKMDAAKYSNWELLATTYLQLDETQKAIDIYREAQKIPAFANDGNIDMQIGNLYFNMQQYRPALEAMLAASHKDVPPKKAVGLYSFMAYIYLYLKEYEQGMKAVDKALELNPTDQSSLGIKRALQDAIEERNRILNYGQPSKTQQSDGTGQDQQAAQTQTPQQTQPATAAPAL